MNKREKEKEKEQENERGRIIKRMNEKGEKRSIKFQDHQDPSTPHTVAGNQPEGGGHPDSAIGQRDRCLRRLHEADAGHGTHDHLESVVTLRWSGMMDWMMLEKLEERPDGSEEKRGKA